MIKRPRFGLRAKVTLIYALGALLLSSSVAVATFTLTQRRLINEFEANAQAQAFTNARTLRPNLQRAFEAGEAAPSVDDEVEPVDTIRALLELTLRANRASLLLIPADGQPRTTGGLEPQNLPDQFRALVAALDETPVAQTYETPEGDLRYAIGLRYDDIDVDYYEVVPLDELANTLRSLRVILIGVSLAASLAGAVLGLYSARRAFQPLSQVTTAAEMIAHGDFEARLDPRVDRDLARLTNSFNEMVDALRSRIERDERFTSDVSHELRSPLMTLAASVEVLERRNDELPPPAQQAVGLLRKDLRRFERLVEDLLEISRIDVGAAVLDPSAMVLADFLRNVIAQSRDPEIPLILPERDSDLIIMADKMRLAQSVTNLIDNATKYGGGATGVSFSSVGDQVFIVVEDAGPGVAPDDRQRIFDRFTRAGADAGRRDIAKGVGLGLSLVAEHVRLHDGEIWVTDRIDGSQGARFVIQIPIGDAVVEFEEMAL